MEVIAHVNRFVLDIGTKQDRNLATGWARVTRRSFGIEFEVEVERRPTTGRSRTIAPLTV